MQNAQRDDAHSDDGPCAGAPRGRRRRCVAALLALSGCAVLGTAAGCSGRGPVRLGFLGGLSGRIADLGIGGRNGALLAVDDLNGQGGIAGRAVELLTRDDQQDPDTARRQTEELVDAGIACLIGPMTSQMALAMLPVAQSHGLPVISPLSGSKAFSGRRDVFFRVVSDAERSARPQGTALFRCGGQRLLPVADVGNAAFARAWNDALVAQFVADGGVALPALEYVAGPEVRFVQLAKQAAASGADVLTIAASAADSAVFLQ